MKVICNRDHNQHIPPYEIWNGQQEVHQEVPARVENILSSLESGNFQIVEQVEKVPKNVLEAIHDQKYLSFLRNFNCSVESRYQYPSVFSLKKGTSTPNNDLAKQGFYSFDMYTPLSSTTYEAAINSASCAHHAASLIKNGKEKVVYSLCRPPGHHAEPAQMGGYCYINNAAIAAETLSDRKKNKVAILDVDFHHGNGTQHIFYDRNDVMTVSIHADPEWKFPYMSGFETEIGTEEGKNYNVNKVLSKGTTDQEYQAALESVLAIIVKFEPDYLIISFGADTHKDDPIGGFALSSEYYVKMGETISRLNIPAAIVQEGGYNTKLLGKNVSNFLLGFSQIS